MPRWPAFVLFLLAAAQLGVGALMEYRQRRERGPVALAPTLHHAFGAAILAALACALLALARACSGWLVPAAFVATLVVGVAVIIRAGRAGGA